MKTSNNTLVLGLGASGEAAARLLVHHGASVTVVDASETAALDARGTSLRQLGVRVLAGVDAIPAGAFDLCVLSPGIAQDSPWVRDVESRGVEVVSELELGFRRCSCPIVAVTGTNGKSTLVKLLHDALTTAGLRSAIGGNYGIPLSEIAPESDALDWIVVEVSSFQLERVSTFRPKVGVFLNLQPDHLDRHGDMEAYRELKSRLFQCMRADDVGIVYEPELGPVKALTHGENRWVTFGGAAEADYRYIPSQGIRFCDNAGAETTLNIAGTAFDNPVLGLAAAAGVAAVQACGLTCDAILGAIAGFSPLSHRMERVRVAAGVTFIDDSKATNLAALKAGVEMVGAPVRLIAGGLLKEKELEFVKEVLAKNVACVYVIGQAASTMSHAWQDAVPCVACGDLEAAVGKAWKHADNGDTVLLSPGCASFDQFRSYKDRGEQFQKIVEDINEERKNENIVRG
jgi:UDP-N-acetylmuramoylalanine--D-glutamate ligase